MPGRVQGRGRGRGGQRGQGRLPGRGRGHGGGPVFSRKWRAYSTEELEAAVKEMKELGTSCRVMQERTGIPRQTLLDNMKKERVHAPPPNRAITEEEETALCSYIVWMARAGFPLTR